MELLIYDFLLTPLPLSPRERGENPENLFFISITFFYFCLFTFQRLLLVPRFCLAGLLTHFFCHLDFVI
jgi:hypothetical protein